jgi:DNA topoisomerase I
MATVTSRTSHDQPSLAGRLRRSDCSCAGIHRVRRGRGFGYVDDDGNRLVDPDLLARVRGLAIPPAWRGVWICRDPLGHLQATGIDAAGRKQYLYHPKWREHRDRQKFERMLRFGAQMPPLRRRLIREMAGDELTQKRVLAGALRLLDVGVFRVGSEEYANEDGGLGLATLNKEHVVVHSDSIEFNYRAKAGIQRRQVIDDPPSYALIAALRRRRGGGPQLLAYRVGRRWHDVTSDDINDYLKRVLGAEFSAKDFRTWSATVLASVSLATQGRDASTRAARKRATDLAVRGVAELLGNTPAVARRAYIDPRVFDRYLSGWTIAAELDRIRDLSAVNDRMRGRIERAVIALLTEDEDSPALEHAEAVAA